VRRNRMLGAAYILTVFLAAAAAAPVNAEAASALYTDRLLLDGEGRDAITMVQYSDAMSDCASRLASLRTTSCAFVPHFIVVRHSFFVWRDETGATINRTPRGQYRLRPPGCLESFCTTLNCLIPGYPNMECDDGIQRIWSAPDRLHFEVDGVVFERIRRE
jgi:hypothetical protein